MAKNVIFNVIGKTSGVQQVFSQIASGAQKANTALNQMSAAGAKAGSNLSSGFSKGKNSATQLGSTLIKLGQFTGLLGKELAKQTFSKTFDNLKNKAGGANSSLARLASSVRSAAASIRSGGFSQLPNLLKRSSGNSDKLGKSLREAIKPTIIKAANSAVNLLNVGLQKTSGILKSISFNSLSGLGSKLGSTFSSAGGNLTKFSKVLLDVNRQMMNVMDFGRMLSQSMTIAGRSIMFFISLPILGFLSKLTSETIEYEDALVRVSKTTGLEKGSGLEVLSKNIRWLAQNTPTAHTELAKMAEVIGQLGVTDPNAITNLVRITDMLQVATDMTAEEVATNLGRIANAFGWNLNESSNQVFKLANTINMLENTTASTAGEITTAIYKVAQSANLLDVPAWAVSAFSATLISMGMSAEEAGTSFRNAMVYVVRNADKVADAIGVNEKYADSQAVINAINKDATSVLMDLVKAASEGGDKAGTLLTLMDIGSMRGGRGLATLASNYQLLSDNMGRAETEWETGTSLVWEYNKATESTKAQLQMLKNNFTELGVTIGDAFLPYLNQAVQVGVALVRRLIKAFKGLDGQGQRMLIWITAGIVLIGPLLMLFSQLFHAVFLVAFSFGQLVKVAASVIGVVGKLLKVIGLIFPVLSKASLAGVLAFMKVPAIILAAVTGILIILQKMGVDVAGFFANLAVKAQAWGENITKTLASGLLAGAVRYIVAAITYIANLIASFFRGFSPPKAGPLKTIDKWGAKVFETYLMGFKKADFGILSEVSSMIERVLTRGKEGAKLAGALEGVAKARMLFAQLTKEFNQSGRINEKILNGVVAGMGEQAKYMKELIRLQLKYNQLQERLAELEQRRKGILAGYKTEIRAIGMSGMSIEEKINSIRAEQRLRDGNLNAIDAEKEGLEEESDMLKEQYEWHKAMIDAMNDQEDLFQRIADALKSVAGEVGGLADELGGFGEGIGDGITEAFDDAHEKLLEIEDRFRKGELALSGFFDALSGKAPKTILDESVLQDPLAAGLIGDFYFADESTASLYQTMYDLGERAAEVRDKIQGMSESVGNFIGGISETIDELKTKLDPANLFSGGEGELFQPIKDAWEDFKSTFVGGFDWLWEDLNLQPIIDAFEEWKAKTKEWGDVFKSLTGNSDVQSFWYVIGKAIAWVLGLIFKLGAIVSIYLVAGFIKLMTWLRQVDIYLMKAFGAIIGFGMRVAEFFRSLPQRVRDAVDGIKQWFSDLGARVGEAFDSMKEKVKEVVTNILEAFGIDPEEFIGGLQEFYGSLSQIAEEIKNRIVEAFQGAIDWVSTQWGILKEKLLAPINEFLESIPEKAAEFIWGFIGGIISMVSNVNDAIGELINGIIESITGSDLYGSATTLLQTFIDGLVSFWEPIFSAGVDLVQGLINGVMSMIGNLAQGAIDLVNGFLNKIKEKLGIASPSTILFGLAVDTIQGFIDGVLSMLGLSEETIATLVDTVIAWLENPANTINKFMEAGRAIIQGFLDGLEEKWGTITTWFSQKLGELPSWVKDLFGIQSPSTVFEDIGTNIVQGLLNGISASGILSGIQTAINSVVIQLKAMMGDLVSWLNGPFLDALHDVGVNMIQLMIDGMVEKFPALESWWMEVVIPMFVEFYKVVSEILTPAIHGLVRKLREYQTAMDRAANRMRTVMPKAFEAFIESAQLAYEIISAFKTVWDGLRSKVLTLTVQYTNADVEWHATGGVLSGQRPAIVGERGPEMLFPGLRGTVVPTHRLMSALSNVDGDGSGKSLAININNPVVRDDTDLLRIKDMIRRALKEEEKFSAFYGGAPTF